MNHQPPRVSDENDDEEELRNNPNNGPDIPEPVPAPVATTMTIKFRDQSNSEVSFKLKPTTVLKKAMDAFSTRTERYVSSLRFVFDGQRVLDENTPAGLEMEDGDTIDVFTEQIGGNKFDKDGNISFGLEELVLPLKLPAQAAATHITVKTRDEMGYEIYFKIKTTTALKGLMNAHATRMYLDATRLRFYLMNGPTISDEDTPASLKMKD